MTADPVNTLRPLSRIAPLVLGWAITILAGASPAFGEDVASEGLEVTAPRSSEIRVRANQRYCPAEGRSGLCDIYFPTSPAPGSGHPVILVVHGGGWMSGDKWTLEGYSRLLAENGFVAVTINYRLAPTHKFPAQIDDVRQALIWTRQNALQLSIDLNRLGIFGYSAGGHLSTLAATLADEPMAIRVAASNWSETDARWKQLPAIQAVCAGGPPCDFRTLPMDNTVMAYFLGGSRREKPDAYFAASPTAHISSSDPVTQIIHGEQDLVVPVAGSRQFHRSQVAAGIDSRLDVVAGQGHMLTFLDPKTGEKVVDFFREVLMNATPSMPAANAED